MFLTIFSSFTRWLRQVSGIVDRELSHVGPSEYAMALVVVICIGFFLLRNRN